MRRRLTSEQLDQLTDALDAMDDTVALDLATELFDTLEERPNGTWWVDLPAVAWRFINQPSEDNRERLVGSWM